MKMRPIALLVILALGLPAAVILSCSGNDIAYPGEIAEDDTALADEAIADSTDDGEESAADQEQAAETEAGDNGTGAVKPAQTVRVTLYFSDTAAVETGTTGATGFVKPVMRVFPHTTAVLRLALEELIRGPLPGEGNLGRTLPAETKILSLKIKDGVALIDFSAELLTSSDSPAGSLGGSVFSQSIVYTATQFPSVEAVLVTVKGEPYSDGHIIWDEPVNRDDLWLGEG